MCFDCQFSILTLLTPGNTGMHGSWFWEKYHGEMLAAVTPQKNAAGKRVYDKRTCAAKPGKGVLCRTHTHPFLIIKLEPQTMASNLKGPLQGIKGKSIAILNPQQFVFEQLNNRLNKNPWVVFLPATVQCIEFTFSTSPLSKQPTINFHICIFVFLFSCSAKDSLNLAWTKWWPSSYDPLRCFPKSYPCWCDWFGLAFVAPPYSSRPCHSLFL